MGLLNKKASRDLFGNRSRILTVFLAMVLGTTVFGTFTFTRELINREIDGEYAAMVPASASVMVDRIDDNLLQLLERHEEISGYEVGASYELMMIRANGTTKTVRLFSSPDYGQQEINIVTPVGGSFSPEQGEVLIDSDALSVADARLGDKISIRLSDETVRQYTITGLVNDLSQHPPSVHDEVYVYVSPETLADMGLSMNRIDYLLSDNQYDRPHILDVSQTLIHLLQDSGYQVGAIHVSNTPGISMHREEYKGALFITQVFSVVAFLFGCIIMSSLLGTILSGQIKQIGVLKSIGAKASNVIHSYMSAVSLLVVCNIVVSLPLSYLAARVLSVFFMSLGNMKIRNFAIPPILVLIVCFAGVVVPMVLAFIPVCRGLSISVKDAINSLGTKTQKVKKDKITKLLANKVSRPILFSLRNAMGNRRRFITNVTMLTLGGLMFIGVMSSIISINMALSKSISAQVYDYQIVTGLHTEDEAIINAIDGHENISDYEIWGITSGQIIYDSGNTGNSFGFAAVPVNTELYRPNLMEGRWLESGDTNAIVVSFEFFGKEPELSLGSYVSFKFAGVVEEFEIVGIINEIGDSNIYMSREGYEQFVPDHAQRSSVNIVTHHTGGRRSAMYSRISEDISENGVSILQSASKADKQKILSAHFTTTLISFLVVSIMVVVVAGVGLATTMNVQVQERTREIGILKSMGASRKQVFSIITAESIYTCLFGFAVCLVLGITFAVLAIQIIGVHILEIPLSVSLLVIIAALVIWLAMTFIVGRTASKKAAKRAADLTAKEALAFE